MHVLFPHAQVDYSSTLSIERRYREARERMMITRDLVWTQVEQAFSRISKLMEVSMWMQ